jgi:predicted adenylyl cyclase CyaB
VREIEVKAVVADAEAAERSIAAAGASLVFAGTLHDRRYDTTDGTLAERGEVLRVRTYAGATGGKTVLDWKGPSDAQAGYKVREEISTEISDASALAAILEKLGYVVIREIDRRIAQYESNGAVVRFEFYPRMDTLVEVEGEPEAIERAIEALGMSRGEFTGDSLDAFVVRFERRTGVRAATSDRDLARVR